MSVEIEQEPDVVEERPLWISAAVIAAGIVVSFAATVWIMVRLGYPLAGSPGGVVDPPIPNEVNQLESHVYQIETEGELGVYERRARLEGWGWVDADTGRIHIPIDVAIELYLGERAATAPPAAPPGTAPAAIQPRGGDR